MLFFIYCIAQFTRLCYGTHRGDGRLVCIHRKKIRGPKHQWPDPTGALTRNFDNMREDEGLADRATFVVDPQGIIQAIEVTAEGIGRDASDLLRKIKAAQYVASHPGEVCPAKWKEGEATLAPSLDLVGKI